MSTRSVANKSESSRKQLITGSWNPSIWHQGLANTRSVFCFLFRLFRFSPRSHFRFSNITAWKLTKAPSQKRHVTIVSPKTSVALADGWVDGHTLFILFTHTTANKAWITRHIHKQFHFVLRSLGPTLEFCDYKKRCKHDDILSRKILCPARWFHRKSTLLMAPPSYDLLLAFCRKWVIAFYN